MADPRASSPLVVLASVASFVLVLAACDGAPEVAHEARASTSTGAVCDRLAADPDDPRKQDRGVPIDALELEEAIEACVAAVEADPGDARLRFQLGRVLVAADHVDDALPFLRAAADAGYPAAQGYMGLLQDTDEAAKPFFERAARHDYAPAVQALAEIEAADKAAAAERAAALTPPASRRDGGYYFGGLIERVSRGELGLVPDDPLTRALLLSMWPVFNAHCGERNPFLALNMMAYGGFSVGLSSLGLMAADPARSDFPSVEEGLRTQRATLFREPGEDAVRLVEHGCGSAELRRFIGNFDRIIASRSDRKPARFDETAFSELMSETFRRRLGLRDPAVARKDARLQRAASAASTSCLRRYADPRFCACMVERLRPMELDEREWRAVGGDFAAVAKLASTHGDVARALGACNQ